MFGFFGAPTAEGGHEEVAIRSIKQWVSVYDAPVTIKPGDWVRLTPAAIEACRDTDHLLCPNSVVVRLIGRERTERKRALGMDCMAVIAAPSSRDAGTVHLKHVDGRLYEVDPDRSEIPRVLQEFLDEPGFASTADCWAYPRAHCSLSLAEAKSGSGPSNSAFLVGPLRVIGTDGHEVRVAGYCPKRQRVCVATCDRDLLTQRDPPSATASV